MAIRLVPAGAPWCSTVARSQNVPSDAGWMLGTMLGDGSMRRHYPDVTEAALGWLRRVAASRAGYDRYVVDPKAPGGIAQLHILDDGTIPVRFLIKERRPETPMRNYRLLAELQFDTADDLDAFAGAAGPMLPEPVPAESDDDGFHSFLTAVSSGTIPEKVTTGKELVLRFTDAMLRPVDADDDVRHRMARASAPYLRHRLGHEPDDAELDGFASGLERLSGALAGTMTCVPGETTGLLLSSGAAMFLPAGLLRDCIASRYGEDALNTLVRARERTRAPRLPGLAVDWRLPILTGDDPSRAGLDDLLLCAVNNPYHDADEYEASVSSAFTRARLGVFSLFSELWGFYEIRDRDLSGTTHGEYGPMRDVLRMMIGREEEAVRRHHGPDAEDMPAEFLVEDMYDSDVGDSIHRFTDDLLDWYGRLPPESLPDYRRCIYSLGRCAYGHDPCLTPEQRSRITGFADMTE